MTVPGSGLLIFAYNEGNQYHQEPQTWWQELVDGRETAGIPWQVSDRFIRQMSNPSIMAAP